MSAVNMAFISSFKVGRETVYPESLRERLRGFPLLADVGEAALRRLLSEANWFGLPGGMLLKRDGENDRALFLVVTGSLGVFVEDEKAGKRLVAHIPAGETVGEVRVPHKGSIVQNVINSAFEVLDGFNLIREQKDGMRAVTLTRDEQHALARSALALRYDPTDAEAPARLPKASCLPRAASRTAATTSGPSLTGFRNP